MSAILDAPSMRKDEAVKVFDKLPEPACWRIPTKAMTLAGFRAWVISDQFPDKVRATFVDEEIYLDMSMEEMTTHAAVKAAICRGTPNSR